MRAAQLPRSDGEQHPPAARITCLHFWLPSQCWRDAGDVRESIVCAAVVNFISDGISAPVHTGASLFMLITLKKARRPQTIHRQTKINISLNCVVGHCDLLLVSPSSPALIPVALSRSLKVTITSTTIIKSLTQPH